MASPHRVVLRPRFYELDPYGHVNHSVYIQYFETARIDLLSTIGFGLDTMLEAGLQLVVVRLATRFVRPAGLADELVVETGMVNTGRVKSEWAQRISVVDPAADDDAGPAVLCTQTIEFAATNLQGRPLRTPAGLAEAMAAYAVDEDWLGKHRP